MATDYLQQAGVAVQPGNETQYAALNTFLSTLSASDRQAALNAILDPNQSNPLSFGIPAGPLNPLSGSQLTQILQQAQKQYKPAPVTPSPGQVQADASNQQQTSATTAATTATAQLPDTTTGQTGAGIPVVGSAGATIPGTTTPSSFNSLLTNYYSQEFAQAGADPNALAQLAGTTPQLLQAQYSAYTQGLAKAQTQFSPGMAGGTVGGQQPMTLPQFAQNKAQAMVGPWASVLDSINTIWQSQYQQPLPQGLSLQIISALNAMPVSQQSNVLYEAYQYMTNKASATANKGLFDQTGSYASAILASLPSSILTYTSGSGTGTGSLGTGGIVGTWAQTYPSTFLQGEETQQEIAGAFQKALNRAPTAADMSALGADPTPAAIQQYIDNQPMPGTHMTYGAYTTISGQLTPLWQQYFGRDPSTSELQWGVGKSTQDITDFIDNSSSSIPGVTIGVKNDYESFINSLDTADPQGNHAFSSQVDDSLLTQLHQQVTAASTGTAKPGKM